jgi:transcription antitermination factor NusA-like protein
MGGVRCLTRTKRIERSKRTNQSVVQSLSGVWSGNALAVLWIELEEMQTTMARRINEKVKTLAITKHWQGVAVTKMVYGWRVEVKTAAVT